MLEMYIMNRVDYYIEKYGPIWYALNGLWICDCIFLDVFN